MVFLRMPCRSILRKKATLQITAEQGITLLSRLVLFLEHVMLVQVVVQVME